MTNAVPKIASNGYSQRNSGEYYVRSLMRVRYLLTRFFGRETLNSGEYLTICYELHHVLLPELSDEGFVEFDRFEDKVWRGMKFDEVRGFLEQIDDDHDE